MAYWRVGEELSPAPHHGRAISRLEGRLVVQANDERWRANLASRVTLAKLKQRPLRQDGELRLADDRELLLIKQLL